MNNRDIDKLVAEKVMGWVDGVGERKDLSYSPDLGFCSPDDLPHYSTDISAAWQVIEKLKEQFVFILWPNSNIAQICHNETEEYLADVKTDSMALSICLAALKAVGVEVSQ